MPVIGEGGSVMFHCADVVQLPGTGCGAVQLGATSNRRTVPPVGLLVGLEVVANWRRPLDFDLATRRP